MQKTAKKLYQERVRGRSGPAVAIHLRYFGFLRQKGTKSLKMQDTCRFFFALTASTAAGRQLEPFCMAGAGAVNGAMAPWSRVPWFLVPWAPARDLLSRI